MRPPARPLLQLAACRSCLPPVDGLTRERSHALSAPVCRRRGRGVHRRPAGSPLPGRQQRCGLRPHPGRGGRPLCVFAPVLRSTLGLLTAARAAAGAGHHLPGRQERRRLLPQRRERLLQDQHRQLVGRGVARDLTLSGVGALVLAAAAAPACRSGTICGEGPAERAFVASALCDQPVTETFFCTAAQAGGL